jgi:hypothetical protein
LEEAARKAATWHSRLKGDIFFENDFQKFIAGAEWQKEQMITKACDWIKYNNENGGCLFDGWEDDFKKAMEE